MSEYRNDYYYSYDDINENIINHNKNKRPKKIKHKRNIKLESLRNFFMISIVFVLGLIIIFNYATITDKKMEISLINDEIELLINEKEEINIELESLKDTNVIEDKAKNYLGMNYPNRMQTEFIEVQYSIEDDNTEYLVAKSNNDSYTSMLFKTVTSLFN